MLRDNKVWYSGHERIKSPFCHKLTIKVFHRPSRLEHKRTHISAGSKIRYYRVLESYEILIGCSNCGKSKKEVTKAFEEGIKGEITHEERIRRLKEAGLSLQIETAYKRERTREV